MERAAVFIFRSRARIFSGVACTLRGMTEFVPPDEAALLIAACGGDRGAFGQLVRAYQRKAYAVAYGLVGNRDDALDLAQEAFVKAYRALDRFDTSMPFYPWLYRILRNTCLNHLKKRKRRGESSLDAMHEYGFDAEDDARPPDGHAGLSDLRLAIHSAMGELTEDQREILQLRHFAEHSYSEIAELLEIPIGTVMSRLHASRKRLKRVLEERGVTLDE